MFGFSGKKDTFCPIRQGKGWNFLLVIVVYQGLGYRSLKGSQFPLVMIAGSDCASERDYKSVFIAQKWREGDACAGSVRTSTRPLYAFLVLTIGEPPPPCSPTLSIS